MSKFSWQNENVLHNTEFGSLINPPVEQVPYPKHFGLLNEFEPGKYDNFLKKNNIISKISRLNVNQFKDICSFYLKNGNDEHNELFIIEPQFLKRISNLETYTIQLIKNEKIIGCVILFHIPVKINKNRYDNSNNLNINSNNDNSGSLSNISSNSSSGNNIDITTSNSNSINIDSDDIHVNKKQNNYRNNDNINSNSDDIHVNKKQDKYRYKSKIKSIVGYSLHTSFLCIHRKYRRKGLGGVLIRQIIEYGICNRKEKEILLGLQILQEQKFACPIVDLYDIEIKNNFRSNRSLTYFYKLHINDEETSYDTYDINLQLSYSFLITLNDDKQILFYPEMDEFKKWITAFPTYCIRKNGGEIICIFSLFPTKVMSGKTITNQGYITWFKIHHRFGELGIKDIDLYKKVINNMASHISEACINENIQTLIIPSLNNFPADILIALSANKNDNNSYFGAYNLNFLPVCDKVMYPYF